MDSSDREGFTEYLKEQKFEPKVVPWRVSQAAKSAQLYRTFRSRGPTVEAEPKNFSWETDRDRARREIRRQGKSFQTEKTYLYWIERFSWRRDGIAKSQCSGQRTRYGMGSRCQSATA